MKKPMKMKKAAPKMKKAAPKMKKAAATKMGHKKAPTRKKPGKGLSALAAANDMKLVPKMKKTMATLKKSMANLKKNEKSAMSMKKKGAMMMKKASAMAMKTKKSMAAMKKKSTAMMKKMAAVKMGHKKAPTRHTSGDDVTQFHLTQHKFDGPNHKDFARNKKK